MHCPSATGSRLRDRYRGGRQQGENPVRFREIAEQQPGLGAAATRRSPTRAGSAGRQIPNPAAGDAAADEDTSSPTSGGNASQPKTTSQVKHSGASRAGFGLSSPGRRRPGSPESMCGRRPVTSVFGRTGDIFIGWTHKFSG
jgi:hypothetical protein